MSAPRNMLADGPEFDRIRSLLAHAPTPGGTTVRIGPGDDAAVLDDGTVLSIDMAVEDVHFRRSWLSFEEIGYRSAAAALSDLAAMAALPVGVLASFALPSADSEAGADLMRGVATAATVVGAVVLGGDLTRSPAGVVVDIAVIGRADAPVGRAGARAGDEIWVSGELGAAAAAVHAWRAGDTPTPAARAAFARPRPRSREARWLARRVPLRALIDVSDGLAGDAAHIAAASGVRITVDEAAVPVAACVSSAVTDADEALRLALSGGDDYELLFAAPAGSVDEHVDAFMNEFAIKLTRIGGVEQGSGLVLRSASGSERRLSGYQHFEGS
jgi:thiamine-monophosphate kinase